MDNDSILGCLVIGLFGWITQDAMTIALTIVKSGTTSAFYNISLIISFLTDYFCFNRPFLWSDYTGTIIIVLSTSMQGYISNKEFEESVRAQQSERLSYQQSLLDQSALLDQSMMVGSVYSGTMSPRNSVSRANLFSPNERYPARRS